MQELIGNEDPTLGQVVRLCKSNSVLYEKLTHSIKGARNERELAQEILFKKGMNYLLSVGIRTMNQEIFVLPLGITAGLTEFMLKRRSIILARYVKLLASDSSLSPDEAYLCGLFYNFRLVCFEFLLQSGKLYSDEFDTEEQNISVSLSDAFSLLGFNPVICNFLKNSSENIYSTENPFLHAVIRIGNQLLVQSDKTGRSTFRNTSFLDPELVGVTGLTLRQLTEPMKEVVKDFKGGTERQ
ncbi:MAG: hypothetical protein VW576_09505 [Opitutae bacterium]